MKPEYVFIVGLPRTGTKLTVNILEKASDKTCQIAPENFFLGRVLRAGVRQKMKKIGDMSADANVKRLVDHMYRGTFFGTYWKRLVDGSTGIEQEILRQRILESDRSDKAIYSILLEQALLEQALLEQAHTELTDNVILGDKTGPHLYHVPTLLEWFPEAKVIHTFRDPRAVLASEHKKLLQQRRRRVDKLKTAGKRGQAIFLELTEPVFSLGIILYVSTAWLYAVRLHHKYKRLYPQNYYLSKFEDLVDQPEANIRKLCEFVDIEFHSGMLTPPRVGSSYAGDEAIGIDKRALDRWHTYLKPWMAAWLLLWGKKYLKEFGYIQ